MILTGTIWQMFWKTDGRVLKATVVLAMLFETAHQVLLSVPLYTYLVSDFGMISKLLVINP